MAKIATYPLVTPTRADLVYCEQSGASDHATAQGIADTFYGKKNADLASAATVNIGAAEGQWLHITGTTTITAFDSVSAGGIRWLIFDGALTLTHNATALILPTGANITTAAGDVAQFVSEGSGNWRCIFYQRKNGQPLVAGSITIYDLWGIAVSDETTAITTGTSVVTYYAGYAGTFDEVFIGLSGQSSSGAVTVNVKKNGTTIFSTNPSAAASTDTNLAGGGTAAVLSTTTFAKGDKLTIDITAAGTGAKGLKVFFRVHY